MTAIQQFFHVEQPYIDPYWAYVKSLLHFNGDLADSKNPAHAWLFTGSGPTAGIITVPPDPILAGTGSLDATASRDAGATLGSNTVFLGTSNFCMEVFLYDPIEAIRGTGYFMIQSVSTSQTVRVYRSGTNTIMADMSGGGPTAPEPALISNVWNHIAVTRNGSNCTLWINGNVAKTWVNSTFNGGTGSAQIYLGRSSASNSGSPSFYDEFRLTVGVPRYTAPFTPLYPFPNRGA